MANILLTEKCVRACPYCFAKKHMDDSDNRNLTWENLIYIADFLDNSNHKKVSLLGGEPTLHPNFNDYTSYMLERGFQINVFTSGILSDIKIDETLKNLEKVSPEIFSFTCNLNHPDISTASEIKQIDKFLDAFGHLTSIGYNVYQEDFDINFLLHCINKFNLKRHVRIGLAHPIPNEKNAFVPISNLKKMGKKFISYFPLFERLNISMNFDCGMPMCIFGENDIGKLYKISNGRVTFGCGPAIDIGPDMTVWSCFPLSAINKRPLYEFNNLQEIISFYRTVHEKIRVEVGGIFEECDNCQYRRNQLCNGGCIAHFVKNFMGETKTVSQNFNLS